jgi:hypothetical protein
MQDTLNPYLDPIAERLFKLLNPTSQNAKQSKCYVQEQAITTLAMVADASEATFAKVGSHTISWPLLMYSRIRFLRWIELLEYHAVVIERTTQCEQGGL